MFDLENSASHLLHRAQQIAANRSAAALRAAGITLRQFSVLSAISEQEGVSQSHLVRATGIDRSTLADMAARMERAKLIKRTVSKTDARAKSLTLMASGRKALAQASPGVIAADRMLMDSLPATRRDGFLRTLTALTAAEEEEGKAKAKAKAKPRVAVKAKPKPKPKAAPKASAKKSVAAKVTKAKKAKPKKKKRKS
ncbi:MAG: MarR family transcriptional regulator [Hyphomonadaceae bacterium]